MTPAIRFGRWLSASKVRHEPRECRWQAADAGTAHSMKVRRWLGAGEALREPRECRWHAAHGWHGTRNKG